MNDCLLMGKCGTMIRKVWCTYQNIVHTLTPCLGANTNSEDKMIFFKEKHVLIQVIDRWKLQWIQWKAFSAQFK